MSPAVHGAAALLAARAAVSLRGARTVVRLSAVRVGASEFEARMAVPQFEARTVARLSAVRTAASRDRDIPRDLSSWHQGGTAPLPIGGGPAAPLLPVRRLAL